MENSLDIFYFVPLIFAFAFGNVHQPSDIGFWIGIVVQWTAVGLITFGLYLATRRVFGSSKRSASDRLAARPNGPPNAAPPRR